LRCDTDHEGGRAEVRLRFEVIPGQIPLLGDVNGDGRADPCLWGKGVLRCDIARRGTFDFRANLGVAVDAPLLGDLDGDGRDELCVFRDGLFLCDPEGGDGLPRVAIRFGQTGDRPLLGDYDGNGRDDPCVVRAGVLRCDIAHDGSGERTLILGSGSDPVVMGNLDGL